MMSRSAVSKERSRTAHVVLAARTELRSGRRRWGEPGQPWPQQAKQEGAEMSLLALVDWPCKALHSFERSCRLVVSKRAVKLVALPLGILGHALPRPRHAHLAALRHLEDGLQTQAGR